MADTLNTLDPTKIVPTRSEQLRLWRKRARLTQARAADVLGCGRTTYARMEAGARPALKPDGKPFLPLLGAGVTLSERLFLARRRSNVELAAVARLLGVSRVTVLKWERNANPELVSFWKGRPK